MGTFRVVSRVCGAVVAAFDQGVDGELALDQAFEAIKRDTVDGELVEQPAEFARQLERLRRRLGDGLALIVPVGLHELG